MRNFTGLKRDTRIYYSNVFKIFFNKQVYPLFFNSYLFPIGILLEIETNHF